ncbi:Oidioi.mRNA.OKI2018_I69.chr2.g6754.t1.cds [Oikopleura dioica]|uniref:Oidioi.mRNA.OKI2018_I69.chr2.g6754.t1.cds n=1 Tax=Oikopleura dioica TaxID=34765 RepID=A0ABN7T405_OIKDI|nr:Oidioi.mRNA.OKI2018_I69.chr2.g6754.t1.cds [Oikopleura dioica]
MTALGVKRASFRLNKPDNDMTHSACLPSFGTSNCRQFAENIFDKSKCKNCMKPREDHVGLASAVVRAKPVHYGWLGLAPPGWSVGAGRRWQRRFFILFDLGTLSWALDDNAGTEPAGSIDLNKPFSVEKAENLTQLPNTICITSKDDGSQILVRSDNSEEFIFWFKSMQKMIADCEEKAKEDKRKKKMLANRRRHHTVSVTATNSALAEARTSFNRERRHQTMTNSSGGLTKRERPTSLATTIPVQSSAPPTPTGSGLTPALCRLVSPQALPILENDKPTSPDHKSTSPTGLTPSASSRAEVDRLGRKDRRIQSSRIAESYNRPYTSSTSTSSYSGRSASVDRRVNYGAEARARTASSDAASPLKASWLSLVNASGFAEAASQVDTSSSNRMWFTLLPSRLIAYASPSSSSVLFELELRKATVKSYDGEKNKYACFIVSSAEKALTIGALTEKIRRNWIETLEDAINAKGSRSSSISSSSDQPGADITNLPPKSATTEFFSRQFLIHDIFLFSGDQRAELVRLFRPKPSASSLFRNYTDRSSTTPRSRQANEYDGTRSYRSASAKSDLPRFSTAQKKTQSRSTRSWRSVKDSRSF